MKLTRRTSALTAVTLLVSFSCSVLAASYPDKPVKVIVGFAAGGAADLVARQIGAKISDQTKAQYKVIIENRTGATGTIAASALAKSPPDGYSLMLASQSTMVVAPSIYPKLPFDPVKDFVPISLLVSMPMVLVVNPEVPAKNLQEFIALARKENSTFAYASAGNGGPQHVAGELFALEAKLKWTHVPYKGEAPAVADVLGGQVPAMFANLPAVAQYIAAGKLRPLAISSAKRHPSLPNLPTVAEAAGLPGYEVLTWYGLFAPAGTPTDIVKKLNDEAVAALKSKDVAAKLGNQGFTLVGTSSADFSSFIKAEVPRWAKLIKDAGILPE